MSILVGLLGAFFICAAAFLRENEESGIQNILEELWVEIDDQRKNLVSRHVAFTQAIAGLTNTALNRLLGPKLISLQSIGVSLCLSYASFLMLLMYFDRSLMLERSPLFDYLSVPIYLVLGVLPALVLKPSKLFLRLWFIAVVSSFFLSDLIEHRFFLKTSWYEAVSLIWESRFFYLGLLIGVMAGIVLIAQLRKILRAITVSLTLPMLVLVVFINALCVLLFLVAPVLYERQITSLEQIYSDYWLFTLWIAVNSNLFIALMGGLFICLGILLLVHKILWPLLERPVYSLQMLGIARRKKVFVALGLLLFDWAVFPRWLTRILAAFM